MTTAKAPFTIRCGLPGGICCRRLGHLRRGIEGTNLISLRRVGDCLARGGSADGAIDRVLPAIRTCQRGQRQNVRLVEAGIGRTVVTVSALWVSVPVLSAHKISIVAASSTAERRVGRTPRFAKARAPSAAARVKVAGSATGIDARTAVRTRGMISASGIFEKGCIGHEHHDDGAVERGEIAHHAQNRLLLRTYDMGGADELGGAAELGARSGRRDLRHRLAAPHQRPRIGLHAWRRLRSAPIRR